VETFDDGAKAIRPYLPDDSFLTTDDLQNLVESFPTPSLSSEDSESSEDETSVPDILFTSLISPYLIHTLDYLSRDIYHKIRQKKDNHGMINRKSIALFDERIQVLFGDHNFDPSLKSIYNFLYVIFDGVDINPKFAILAMVYIDRLTQATGMGLETWNWRPVAFTAVLLATKVWEDLAIWNIDFADCYGLEVDLINKLEREFLIHINFDLCISGSDYAKYYFDSRSYMKMSVPREVPLDDDFASKIIVNVINTSERSKQLYIHRSKCSSLGSKAMVTVEDFRSRR